MARGDEATSAVAAQGFLSGNIDHPAFDVLPFVPKPWLDDAFQRLAVCDLDRALKDKIVPVSWIPTMTMYAVVTEHALTTADALGLKVVARIRPEDYRAILRRRLGQQLLDKAVCGLARQFPQYSARTRLTTGQGFFAFIIALICGLCLVFLPVAKTLSIACSFATVFFAAVVTLRLFCLITERVVRPTRGVMVPKNRLPIYTVLVPLFRETEVLDQLIAALANITYPQDKLDIKLLLEEADHDMHRALARFELPDHFDVIIVPAGKPQTKPRALNYGLQFARGSLVTIFDSEDLPRPLQLRQAAQTFSELPDDVACLQAALVFYNGEENWLTKHFAAEYAALFNVVLPALAERQLPLLLGGTSNHFRLSALKAVGAWDPFNVTEDADLGIRLARHGYVTGVLDSETYEEANTSFFNWMRQRRRWLKGFLQTWLVHMREPIMLYREIGLSGFIVVQCMTLGIFASALLHPFLVMYSLWSLMPDQVRAANEETFSSIFAGVCLALLVSGYAIAIIASHRGLAKLGHRASLLHMTTLPAYWLMLSAAAWMALWDFIVNPFHWHKTQHGISRMSHHKQTAPEGIRRRRSS